MIGNGHMFPEKEKAARKRGQLMSEGLFAVSAAIVLSAQVGGVESQNNAGRDHHNVFLLSMNKIGYGYRIRGVWFLCSFSVVYLLSFFHQGDPLWNVGIISA